MPHLAEIACHRSEPENISPEQIAAIKERFAKIAATVVAKSLLKQRKTITKKAQDRIRDLDETDARRKSAGHFIELWNYWRDFYFEVRSPMRIKTKGQLTCVENIVAMCEENDLNLKVLLGCVHRAFVGRKVMPSLQIVVSHGLEIYEQHYEDVVADIERASYERRASGIS